MKPTPIFAAMLLFICIQVYGQSPNFECGTDRAHQALMLTDSAYRAGFNLHQQELLNKIQQQSTNGASRNLVTIPVVVHVIHTGGNHYAAIPDDTIRRAIDGINERFRNLIGNGTTDVELQFCLASRDPNGYTTNGIVRVNGSGVANYATGGVAVFPSNGNCSTPAAIDTAIKNLSRWPRDQYYNIWLVNTVCGGGGYAQFPNDNTTTVLNDGAVLPHYSFRYGLVDAAHEIGHGFDLFHTFQGDNNNSCPTTLLCSITGDECCDTPPHKQSDCNSLFNPCTTSGIWDNSYYNFMSYCRNDWPNQISFGRFTPDQKDRIQTTLTISPRASLQNSLGCQQGACLPPSNDECMGNYAAVPLTFGSSCNPISKSTCGATASGFSNCQGVQDDDVFFSFTPNTSTATITVSSSAGFDAVFQVLTGPCGTSMTQLTNGCVNSTGTGGTETVTLTGLSTTSTYFIRVWHNGTGYGTTGNFTICAYGSSSSSCATPTGTAQSSITQTSATLSWGSVASATNYTVQYRVSGTSTWTTATTANTSYPLSNLNCNTTYEWQVRANCSSGNSSYSAIKSFPTNTCGTSCTPPNYDDCANAQLLTSNGACFNGTVACANGSYGANQCSGCSCTSPDDKDVYFKFTAAATSHTVELSNYASNFDGVIELRTDCAFGTSNGCYDPAGTPTTVSNTWNNLIPGQPYYIRVFEFNYTGTPPSSPTFTICLTHTTGGGTTCSTPSVLPVTNLTQSTATLNWGSVSSAISYTLQVRQSGGSWQTFNTTSTSYSFTGFACNTTYQWQVSANCANGSSAFTAIQSFSTLGCGGGTSCSAPTGLAVSNVGQNSATLSWNSVTGVTYYIVRYRTGGTSWSATNTTSIPFTANNLSCNSVYEWQIEAVCPNGNYPTSGTNFTTGICTNGCINSFQDRTLSAPTCASPLPPYTTEWQTDYVRVNNVVGGETYISNHSLGGWITIRYGTYNGTLVAQGSPPLTWNANQGSGTYFIHYNTNSSCGQANNPGTSTLEIVCCTTPAQPGNITGNSPVCSGTFQSYSISPVAGATSYTWSLPAGWSGSSSTNSISATPGSSGGTISVTANNSCGNSQPRTLVINVNQAPAQPGTITGATNVCSGVAQTYSISAVSGATNYTWSFSGGGTISGSGTSINFTPASNGTLAVIANNTCGSSNPRTLAIAINQTPTVVVNSSTDTICSGGSGTILNAISDAQNFTWSPATGLSATTGQTITANPTNNTTYTVTATNGNCSATASSVVTISNQLSVSINPANPVICGNSSVSLTVTTGTAYTWSGPNSFTDNSQTVLATNAGSYSVTVTNPSGCSGSATASISVTQNPSLIIDAGANQVIQPGNSVQLGGTPTASGGTPPYTFSWNPTTALSSSSVSNPSANPTSNTTYNLTVTDSKGCFATDNVSVITSIDCQTFLFDSLSISVPHDSATYSFNLTTGVGCPWAILEGCSWLSFNNTTGNGTSSLTFTVAENTFTSPRTCYVNIEGNILIITQGQAAPCLTPVSDFTASQQAIFAGNTVTFSDNSTNTPSQWEWTFNGGNPATSTAQNPTVTYSSGGLFNVTLKATNNCGNNTLTKPNFINVIGTVGIDNAVFENSISIYPNPNSGTFRIVAQTPTQKAVQLKLFSAIGQLVYSEQVLPFANKIEKDISVGNIATGIYLLQITVNNKPSYKKLIIE